MTIRSRVSWVSVLGACLIFSQVAAERLEVDFQYVQERAKERAAKPYEPPQQASERLLNLSYDQYRSIRFDREQALWQEPDTLFQLQFVPAGNLHRSIITVHEFSERHSQEIPYVREWFTSEDSEVQEALDDGEGYAGFRVFYPINEADVFDETLVFLGASYFRAVGREQEYGVSARGLALDTGLSREEEFPVFREFWLSKPEAEERNLRIFALLDGPSVAGAYSILVRPGEATRMEIEAVLFFRKVPEVVGLAPLTSMFWYGKQSMNRFDDYRPAVHDSEGLLVAPGDGQWLWRPLVNGESLRTSLIRADSPRGFGLLQRARDFRAFQDLHVHYHRRPSAWIEPHGDWQSGHVRLYEFPTDNEWEDNIVAFWEPESPPAPGEPYTLAYTLHWGDEVRESQPGGRVTATRIGQVRGGSEGRFFVVDFDSPDLRALDAAEAVEAEFSTGGSGRIEDVDVRKNPFEESWRAAFQVVAEPTDLPIELRVYLHNDGEVLTETWTYSWRD